MSEGPPEQSRPPQAQSYGALFRRFLRFGCLAWGGPIAQVAMIQRELVDEERWISREKFNHVYAMYQVLPGPEAHELCVYFGTVARGRIGGIVAGLGFMLPGLLLMLAASWAYANLGYDRAGIAPVLAGIQAAVIALLARAVFRIGAHAVTDRWHCMIALASGAAALADAHFALCLALGAVAYPLAKRKPQFALALILAFAAGVGIWWFQRPSPPPDNSGLSSVAREASSGLSAAGDEMQRIVHSGYDSATGAQSAGGAPRPAGPAPSLGELLTAGLRAGFLTFGGAYTAIPYLRHDAVEHGGWMTDAQFLDGVAIGGILPAPLIILGTFVGFMGGAFLGALIVTAAIFLPAFGFSLVGHDALERLTSNAQIRAVLDGVTSAVVGLIAATAIELGAGALRGWKSIAICVFAFLVLQLWKSRAAVPAAIALGAAVGYFL